MRNLNISSLRSLALLACVAGLIVATAAVGQIAGGGAEPVTGGGPTSVRRLSEEQYRRAIAQTFGPEIEVAGRFEPRVREEGLLAVGDSHVAVTSAGFEQYALRAREIAQNVVSEANRARHVQCTPQDVAQFDEACASQFLARYGRLLYRRPLAEAEMAAAMDLSRRSAMGANNFYAGLGTGLSSLLMSPAFIFRIESAEPDPARPGQERLDAYSLATRISFLLWDGPPDEELLNAAASGSLRTEAGLRRQVDRLMNSPRLEQGVRAFFSDMFAYNLFEGLSKDSALFPIFNPQLRDDAREQSMRTVIDHLITRNGDYRDLFTTRRTFLTRSLAALYAIRFVDPDGDGWMPYTFPAGSPYSGLLTMPAFLMLDPSHEGRSSPTIRGKTVRENYMCEIVPMPPGDVDFSLFEDTANPEARTARDRLSLHRGVSPTCAGCHRITDPIGLALENYTPVGAFRTHENEVLIDASGELDGQQYANALELSGVLRGSESISSCVVQRAYEYGLGRTLTGSEEQWLEQLNQRFVQGGYKFPALLRQIAMSASFQAVSGPTERHASLDSNSGERR